jgi:hypothetical protein
LRGAAATKQSSAAATPTVKGRRFDTFRKDEDE